MGMYTQLVLGVEVEDDPKVIRTLKYMLGKEDFLVDKWDHELFQTTRWKSMLKMDSAYFDGFTDSDLVHDYCSSHLNVRCNLKNYDGEIGKFLNWLSPYIKTYGFLGYLRYEEDEDPTLIYNGDKGIEYKIV